MRTRGAVHAGVGNGHDSMPRQHPKGGQSSPVAVRPPEYQPTSRPAHLNVPFRRMALRSWTRLWRASSSERAKRRGQSGCWHANGRSPVWVRMCVVRWSEREKRRLHVSHWNGFSPVCFRWWRTSSSERVNVCGVGRKEGVSRGREGGIKKKKRQGTSRQSTGSRKVRCSVCPAPSPAPAPPRRSVSAPCHSRCDRRRRAARPCGSACG